MQRFINAEGQAMERFINAESEGGPGPRRPNAVQSQTNQSSTRHTAQHQPHSPEIGPLLE